MKQRKQQKRITWHTIVALYTCMLFQLAGRFVSRQLAKVCGKIAHLELSRDDHRNVFVATVQDFSPQNNYHPIVRMSDYKRTPSQAGTI
jgi:hypothetical protein